MIKKLDYRDDDIVRMYVADHLPMRAIAAKIGISHGTVAATLKRCNITAAQGEWVEMQCATCNGFFMRKRAHAKRSKRPFCSDDCYFKARATTEYRQHRQGQRIAREVVSEFVDLPPGSVVHHEDGDNDNNDPANLKLFASQSDHLKYHHGVHTVFPLWDGSSIQEDLRS